MKHCLLAVLMFASIGRATTIDGFESEHQLGSAYGFDFGYANSDSTFLYIDGPGGREWFRFGFLGSTGMPVMNAFGLLVSAGEATEDPYLYYAQYGFGGEADGTLGGSDIFSFVPGVPRDDNDQYTISAPEFDGFVRGTVTYKDWSQPTEDSSYTVRTDSWSFAGPPTTPSPSGFTARARVTPIPEPSIPMLLMACLAVLNALRWAPRLLHRRERHR
jgi:hypothetical protein